jgi:predicted phage-related endonuclease
MGIKYHPDLIQGSEEWLNARLGLLTASEMKHIITPGKLQYASNDKSRSHLYEIAAQRISQYVEPSYIGDDMLRGLAEELDAKLLYDKYYAKTKDCGFITNDVWGFTLGYSPDALVGEDGLIECKSRRQKYQIETIINGQVPTEYIIQIQTGLLVSEREWLDFVSYSGGLPMFVMRVHPDAIMQAAIISAATTFHEQLEVMIAKYEDNAKLFYMTERKSFDDIITGSIGASVQDSKALALFDKDAQGNKERFMFGEVK